MGERRYSDGFEAAVLDRLDRIERRQVEQAQQRRRKQGGARKRAKTVAERVAAGIRYQPTELQMAAMRRKLRAG